jgi:hypothetical protein
MAYGNESLVTQLFEATSAGELIVPEDGRVRSAKAEAHQSWLASGILIELLFRDLLPELVHATHPVTAHPSGVSSRRMGELLDEFVTCPRDGIHVPAEITPEHRERRLRTAASRRESRRFRSARGGTEAARELGDATFAGRRNR